jgi:putative SOS response-associated peptidase YedK
VHEQYSGITEPQLNNETDFHPSYNVAPTRMAPTYRIQKEGGPVLQYMSWGLVPFWTKEQAKATQYKTFNARKESILDGSKMWSSVVQHHRCVVPVEGYYEWLQKPVVNKMGKIPYYIKRKDNKLMFLAGMWSSVHFEDTNRQVDTFTVITGPAPKNMEWLHLRMPIVLEPGSESWDKWLGNEIWNVKLGEECLKIHEHDDLEWFEVSRDVGKTTNDGAYLVDPVKKGGVAGFFDKMKREVKEPSSEIREETRDRESKVKEESHLKDYKRLAETFVDKEHSDNKKAKH